MTVCPIAIAVGCKKCLVFSGCPVKTIIGDQPRPDEAAPARAAAPHVKAAAPHAKKKKKKKR